MLPTLLFVVTSSPEMGGRVAEALRIAAGVGAWKKIEPLLYLRGQAVKALNPDASIVEEDNVERYLELLAANGTHVLVDCEASLREGDLRGGVAARRVSDLELARIAASAKYAARF